MFFIINKLEKKLYRLAERLVMIYRALAEPKKDNMFSMSAVL